MFYGFGEASSVEALENGGKSQEWWTLIEEENKNAEESWWRLALVGKLGRKRRKIGSPLQAIRSRIAVD
jgi:hypothetical protein